jgi:hypothetical protein
LGEISPFGQKIFAFGRNIFFLGKIAQNSPKYKVPKLWLLLVKNWISNFFG